MGSTSCHVHTVPSEIYTELLTGTYLDLKILVSNIG